MCGRAPGWERGGGRPDSLGQRRPCAAERGLPDPERSWTAAGVCFTATVHHGWWLSATLRQLHADIRFCWVAIVGIDERSVTCRCRQRLADGVGADGNGVVP